MTVLRVGVLVAGVMLGLPCSKEDAAPPPPVAPAPTGPTAEDVAKWTKIRAGYEASSKAAAVRPDVAAAMLSLADGAKATGDRVLYGMKTEVKVGSGDSDFEAVLGINPRNNAVLAQDTKCPPLDRRTSAEHFDFLSGFGVPSDKPSIFVTATIGENPAPLRLTENGSAREVRQLQVTVKVRIQATGKPPIEIERKVDVHGFELSGMVREGYVLSTRRIYEHELEMLEPRTCAAAREILGLQDPLIK